MIVLLDTNDHLSIIPSHAALDKLYFEAYKVPSEKEVKAKLKTASKEVRQFFAKSISDAIQQIKINLSNIDTKIPLYDEYSRNIYLIDKNNVYSRVAREHYRFPDKAVLKMLKTRQQKLDAKIKDIPQYTELEKHLGEFEKSSKEHYKKAQKDILLLREARKLKLMLEFMENFDHPTLVNTYVRIFYYYSNEVGKNITACKRPSFKPHFKHITPYYTRSELINLALNMEIIKPSSKMYTSDEVEELCLKIRDNDIKADTILSHQKFITESDKIGIVQYYTLQGSYFMNQYMRNLAPYEYQNDYLEDQIRSMWQLTLNAPAFDKSYIVYRFIKTDEHINNLGIGDVYQTPSFLSTTRDPFYRSDQYKFGFILLKIKIPAKKIGSALCIETISHFPQEEEIILPPLSNLKLTKKDQNCSYFHTDDIYESNIRTRYEFTLIGHDAIQFPARSLWTNKYELINFLELKRINTITMNERIQYFTREYALPFYQFQTKIGERTFTIKAEWYDSTSAYKDFYAARTDNGFLMYSIVEDYTEFTIELGEDEAGPYMYVNYYFKHSTSKDRSLMSDKEFIKFISTVAHYFEVDRVLCYTSYTACDLRDTKTYFGGNFCLDYYNYLKSGIKRYSDIDSAILKPYFSYYQLDRMKTTSPNKVLRKGDRDEIYQIYMKTYHGFMDKTKDNIADFYVWLVDHHCSLVKSLTHKIGRMYDDNNPFQYDFYVLDPITYLYNLGIIDSYPDFSSHGEKINIDITMPKNEYRMQSSDNPRAPRGRTRFELK